MRSKLSLILFLLCFKAHSQFSPPPPGIAFVTTSGQEIQFSKYKIKGGIIEYEFIFSEITKEGSIKLSDVDYYYDTSLSKTTYYLTTLPNGRHEFLQCAFVGDKKVYMKFKSGYNGHPITNYYLGDKNSCSLVLIYGSLMTNKQELKTSLSKRIKSNTALYQKINSSDFVYNYKSVYPVIRQFILEENSKMNHNQRNGQVMYFGRSKKLGNGVKLKLLDEEYYFHQDFRLQVNIPANVTFIYEFNGEKKYLTGSPHYSVYYEVKKKGSVPGVFEIDFTTEQKAFIKARKLPNYIK